MAPFVMILVLVTLALAAGCSAGQETRGRPDCDMACAYLGACHDTGECDCSGDECLMDGQAVSFEWCCEPESNADCEQSKACGDSSLCCVGDSNDPGAPAGTMECRGCW